MFPSIHQYISGKKDGQFVVKVFLQHEDPEAVEYVRQTIPKNFNAEFVRTDQQSKKEKELKGKQNPINKEDFQKLNTVIETVRERIMKMYSVVTAIFPEWVELEGSQTAEPCVVLLCLDKTLIPFGEQEIPKKIHEYPVVIREDRFSLTHCSNPNNHEISSGCSIGPLSDAKRGSVGFLARHHVSKGFLTAAHVAIKELSLLSRKGTLLSQLTENPEVYEIVHPSWEDCECNNIIGRVEDAFIGNYGPNQIGIDAAWIKLYKQDSEGNI